ncbi:MAG TPA: aspartyl/asparaginyl beta-hydroxylase domain-containing protein [Steroidobacteraceae bacterium]|nr:aspartyl/asparaginyl beta-hydroxylase domain-containing protein [Steroidobacteraceae bacterium]
MNSTTAPVQPDEAAIIRALQASKAAAAAGRMAESDQLLARLARQSPDHPAVLNELGVRMLARGAAEQAHQLFVRATAADPRHPSLWANLASSLKALGRRAEELDAIEKALQLEPRHLSALLQYAQHLEQSDEKRRAARAYQNALATIPADVEPPAAVREALNHARSVVEADNAALSAMLEMPLAEIRERHGGQRQRRVDRCLDILMGRARSFHSQPTWLYFPELPEIDFFERSEFPWLDAIEAATDEIRAELMRVLVADRQGLQPYIDFPTSMPLDQWRDLNRSRRWSAYFLWNQGEANAGHIARCPVTARMLETAPRCRVASRAPTAFFSILDANTKIPPHTGVTNTRCTVHLPLIVPPGCRFRVGATTREWVPGQAWVFDDTIEHEAWNDSDTPRGILIFDVWNPLLTAAERDMIQTANELYVRYYAEDEGQRS